MENILLDRQGHIVITDFGLSKDLGEEDFGRTCSYCGTIEYMAPEVQKAGPSRGQKCYTYSVDWWSCAVLWYELIRGKGPFTPQSRATTMTPEEVNRMVTDNVLNLEVEYPPQYFSEVTKSLLQPMMNRNPEQRLGANGVQEIKYHAFFEGIDWEDVAQKRLVPPHVPPMENETDVSNFSPEFTQNVPVLADGEGEDPFGDNHFPGYSYIPLQTIYHQIRLDTDEQECAFYRDYKILPPPEESNFTRGSEGNCFPCVKRTNQSERLVKVYNGRSHELVMREVAILSEVKGRNIVKFYDHYHYKNYDFIVMEKLQGGELLKTLKKYKTLKEKHVINIYHQILDGLKLLESKNVCHLDIKPENLVFAYEPRHRSNGQFNIPTLKIVDFGSAQLYTGGSFIKQAQLSAVTLPYCAPEVLLPGKREVCNRTDLWSLGVILFMMLSGKSPFYRGNTLEQETIANIVTCNLSMDTSVWQTISHPAKMVVQRSA